MSTTRTMFTAALLATLVAGASPARAGSPAKLEPGARVRATVVEREGGRIALKKIEGTLVALGDSTIMVKPTAAREGRAVRVIPRTDLDRLEVQVHGSRRGRGALIGLGTGALFGAMIGLASGDDSGGFVAFSAEQKAGMGAILLAPIGALLGTVVAPGAKWETVPDEPTIPEIAFCGAGRPGVFLVTRF